MTISTVRPAYDLDQLRNQFPITRRVAYLNHAGLSPLAASVKKAMIDAVEAIASTGSRIYSDLLDPLEEQLPQSLARLVNAHPEEIALTTNTSLGINMIAQSLPLNAGDNVLLCDVEFPANVYPWMNLARRGIDTRIIKSVEGGLNLEEMERARDARSRVVAASAVQFFTGRREDLSALGRYCADHELWLVVDAIQAAELYP